MYIAFWVFVVPPGAASAALAWMRTRRAPRSGGNPLAGSNQIRSPFGTPHLFTQVFAAYAPGG